MKRDALRHIYGHLEQSSRFVEVTVGSRDRKTDFGYIRADFDLGDATIDTFSPPLLYLLTTFMPTYSGSSFSLRPTSLLVSWLTDP
jgi:hypothetical protein